MAIFENPQLRPLDESDPDDYRPRSLMAMFADPEAESGYVRDLSVLVERMAHGDRIPLHRHPVDEIVILHAGRLEATVAEVVTQVTSGALVFIPAGAVHGFRNTGDDVAELYGIFPTATIGLEYIARNAAPGTEGEPPQPLFEYDVRSINLQG